MQQGLFTRLVTALGRAFGRAADYLATPAALQELLDSLGWTVPSVSAAYSSIQAPAQALLAAVQSLPSQPTYTDLAQVVQRLLTLLNALAALPVTAPAGIDDPDFTQQFRERLLAKLLTDGIQDNLPTLYYLLAIFGIIAPVDDPLDTRQNRVLNLERLQALLTAPADYPSKYLGWGLDFVLDSQRQADVLGLLDSLGVVPALLDNATAAGQGLQAQAADQPERNLLLLPIEQLLPTSQQRLLSLVVQPTTVFSQTFTETDLTDVAVGDEVEESVTNTSGDELRFYLLPHVNVATELALGSDVKLALPFVQTLQDGFSFTIGPAGFGLADEQNNPLLTLTLDPAVVLSYAPTEPIIFIGEPGKTRLQADALELALDLSVNRGVKLELSAINSQLIINGDEGDSFLSKVLPNTSISVPLSVALSSVDGLRFNGSNSFNIRANVAKRVGSVLIQQLSIGIVSTDRVDIQLNAHADIAFALGPLIVSVVDTGVSFSIPDLSNPKDLAFGFDLPKGIGIEVISDTITGGGYLFIDPANHKYAGAAQLTFKEKINLNALGLLQTELPNNQPGYSLALLITAQFNPIQLGLGFTLNAIGGLVGVNRAANVPYLRSLVQAGRQDTLLFPANVLSNPQAALATLDNAFPATEDRYVFGLMARIGWGTPNLLTLDAALIIELPAPVRLILLGVLRAVLPDLNTPIIRLRADFLGVVDFGAKKISFDAMLVDSRILQFALTGNMAFRLYQGENPVFLITAGGFHPSFQPPANADLPTLRRITLALAQGGDFRLTLTSYLAITTSTVQFGSRLDLYVGLPSSFYIEGFLSFDALFQFNPFYVQVQIGAGVAIKRNGSAKLTLSLNLLVSGPGPWHVRGEGSFKILFFRIRFTIDRTFGSNTSQPALPATDVRPLLKAALVDSANWEVLPPAVRASSTTVLRSDEQPGELLVDPAGALVVRQKVVPLDYPVEVYGNTRPTNGTLFSIPSVALGGTASPVTVSGTALGEVRDAFAPGQFRRMSDGQKLSAPSFQLMRSGLRLDVVDGLVSSTGTVQTTEFELQIIAPATGTGAGFTAGTAGRPADSSQRVAGTGTPVVITPTVQPLSAELPGELFQRLARNGAVGRAARSYEQRRPSRKAPDQVLWDEDAYAVVRTRTLQPSPGAPNPFPTEAEATAYVTQQLALNPSLAGELQVVPVYQLDVSAPATASNLATA